MAARIHTRVQGNRYMYQSECLNCDWTHFGVAKVTTKRGKVGRGADPAAAAAYHVRAHGHKVRVVRTWVLSPALDT